MEKNIVNKIEGAKIWNYVAIGSGLIFVGGAIWMVKEIYEAKQAAKNKALALAELEKATALAGESTGENFSGCSGCSSAASGVMTPEKPTELVSNASGIPRFAQINRPIPPSYRKKLSEIIQNPPIPNIPTTNPPTPCGNGGIEHWDAWGGGTKVCRGNRNSAS